MIMARLRDATEETCWEIQIVPVSSDSIEITSKVG